MSGLNALFSAAFLILVVASVAVTGSMAVLALIDFLFRKKQPGAPGEESPLDQVSEHADEGNQNERNDAALARLHAEQMRKFRTSQGAL